MTDLELRDQFAISALAGAGAYAINEDPSLLARAAYGIADAMMAERARHIPPRQRPAPTAIPGPGTP